MAALLLLLLLLAVTSSKTLRQIVWSPPETIDTDVGNQILLRNRTDSDAICSFASRPLTPSRLSVLTGVCVCVCVCQVHGTEHTEAHTVGQTGHNIIIPDIDLVSAELEGKTCTPAVHTRLSLSHTHRHIF